jgi:hypothetical protein
MLDRIRIGDTRKNFISEKVQGSLTAVRVKRMLSPGVDFARKASGHFAGFDAVSNVPALILNRDGLLKNKFVHFVGASYSLERLPLFQGAVAWGDSVAVAFTAIKVTMYSVASSWACRTDAARALTRSGSTPSRSLKLSNEMRPCRIAFENSNMISTVSKELKPLSFHLPPKCVERSWRSVADSISRSDMPWLHYSKVNEFKPLCVLTVENGGIKEVDTIRRESLLGLSQMFK